MRQSGESGSRILSRGRGTGRRLGEPRLLHQPRRPRQAGPTEEARSSTIAAGRLPNLRLFAAAWGRSASCRAGRSYRLKIASPAGIALQPKLPPAASDQKIVLGAGSGVFRGDSPLAFNLRASQAGIPLAAAAWLRGVLVGQQTLVTTLASRGRGGKEVEIPLEEQVGGLIRLAIYNYGVNPPRPIAQRWVYRPMPRRLTIQILGRAKRYAPGEKVNLTLRAADEKGRPAAVLGVAVVDQAALGKGGESTANLAARFLCPSPLDEPDGSLPIEPALSDDKNAAAAMDLLLGTQACGKLPEKPLPLFLSDNLGEIRAKYEESRAEYQQKRTQLLRAIAALCFFGGLGLLLLLALLNLLRATFGRVAVAADPGRRGVLRSAWTPPPGSSAAQDRGGICRRLHALRCAAASRRRGQTPADLVRGPPHAPSVCVGQSFVADGPRRTAQGRGKIPLHGRRVRLPARGRRAGRASRLGRNALLESAGNTRFRRQLARPLRPARQGGRVSGADRRPWRRSSGGLRPNWLSARRENSLCHARQFFGLNDSSASDLGMREQEQEVLAMSLVSIAALPAASAAKTGSPV